MTHPIPKTTFAAQLAILAELRELSSLLRDITSLSFSPTPPLRVSPELTEPLPTAADIGRILSGKPATAIAAEPE